MNEFLVIIYLFIYLFAKGKKQSLQEDYGSEAAEPLLQWCPVPRPAPESFWAHGEVDTQRNLEFSVSDATKHNRWKNVQ